MLYDLNCPLPLGKEAILTENLRQLDPFDRKIIAVLRKDGRIAVTELAKKVGLSNTPCQVRLKRLLENGFIEGFCAVINPQKFGLDHVAFVEVKLSDTPENALAKFNAAVRAIPEVEECYMIAGRFDYLLKVRTAGIMSYREVLGERISALPFVANTSTSVSMQAVKETWLVRKPKAAAAG